MPAPTRPYAAIPADAGKVLRPVLPSLADEIIAAIAREVPDYARAMEGEFGQVVRVAIERALGRFIDLIEDPASDDGRGRAAYVDLGRGEMRAGRSLEALLSAYRLGSRLAWRRFVEAGVAGGLDPGAIYALGEAIFAYIDELSAESAEGYAEEQSAAAGERQRLRRRLVRLLAQDVAAVGGDDPGRRGRRGLAAAAERGRARDRARGTGRVRSRRLREGRLPRTRLRNGGLGRGGHLGRDPGVVGRGGRVGCPRGAAGAADRGGGDRGRDRAAGGRARARRRRARPRPAAHAPPPRAARPRSGPRCRSRSPGSRSAAPIATHALLAEGRLGDRDFARAEEHLPALVIAADPALGAELAQQRLAPLQTLADGPRARLTETLRAWLDRPGQVQAVAAELGVHPQTVRYRVKQLRELFGDRLEDPEARFELGLALRAWLG